MRLQVGVRLKTVLAQVNITRLKVTRTHRDAAALGCCGAAAAGLLEDGHIGFLRLRAGRLGLGAGVRYPCDLPQHQLALQRGVPAVLDGIVSPAPGAGKD